MRSLQPQTNSERRRSEPYNSTAFGAYAKEANAPALPETLRLYKRLQELGIKPVILTGRREDKRESTAKNLAAAGYTGYEKLLLKYVHIRTCRCRFDPGFACVRFFQQKKKPYVRALRVTTGVYACPQASGREGDFGGVQVR
jgi:hypothetical protein